MKVRNDQSKPWIEPGEALPSRPGPEREDVPGPLDTSSTRRAFLAGLGIGAAVSLSACQRSPVRHALPFAVPPEDVTPGVPVHYASTCQECPAACGLMVTVLDGRPVKLEGHPGNPHTAGGLCATGQAGVRALYDSGRLQEPLLAGRPVSFEALDAHVSARLADVRKEGKRVYLLSPSLGGPVARETIQAFLAPFAGTHVEFDAGAAPFSAVLEAYEVLTGRLLAPALDLSAADLIVSFGADLFGGGPEPVAHTRGWSARRRLSGSRGEPRFVQIEGSLSLTGAAADERWTATSSERRSLVLLAAAEIARLTGSSDVAAALGQAPSPPPRGERILALANSLVEKKGKSIVVSGSSSLGEQLAVALINRMLANEGKTLDLERPSFARRGVDRGLAKLLADVESGAAGAVVILDSDPVDHLPSGEAFGKALAKLPLSVSITSRPTATAAASAVVAAAHHFLERWGDFEPRAGFVTFAQPAIQPLFKTRHPLENLLVWSGAPAASYREHLRDRWQALHGGGESFSAVFRKAVQTGMSDELSALLPKLPPPVSAPDGVAKASVALAAEAAARGTQAVPLEVDLVAQAGIGDGRNTHVPWLRELPDPLTRVSWTPCLRIAPSRAKEMGVADGDHVTVEANGHSVTLPARIVPGQDVRVLAVPVGYGLKDGDGGAAARNGYRLARMGGRVETLGLTAKAVRAAAREDLPLMQPHGATEGRPVVYQLSSHSEPVESLEHHKAESLWPERVPTVPKWEMVIDLDLCTGCSGCVVACQAENNIPVVGPDEMRRNRDMHWLRIDRYFTGDEASPDVLFEPMFCSQCENAPCETVCPVAATVHSEDGLNQQVYNRCVGTRYCANNCPYKVRRFNWFDYKVAEPVERLVLNPKVVVRSRGVMEKCTFCVQRIQSARIEARREGHEDWHGKGGQTACQESCPARAITFGDATDPDGAVAALKKSPRAFQVLGELGVRPAVTYLAKVRTRTTKSETRREA